MELPKSNSFTQVELPVDQIVQGKILSNLQKAVIQNERASIAEQILHLTYVYKTTEPLEYGIKLAYLQGQLDILSYLINSSEDAVVSLIKPQQE